MIKSETDEFVLEGLIIASLSCLNSLIEIDDQFEFFYKVYLYFTHHLLQIMELLNGTRQ